MTGVVVNKRYRGGFLAKQAFVKVVMEPLFPHCFDKHPWLSHP